MEFIRSLVSFVGWWVVIGLVILGVCVGVAQLRFWYLRRKARAKIARFLAEKQGHDTRTV